MSWIWRQPRVPVQATPGWQAPHELVKDYAARGVEIAKLNGTLIRTEQMLNSSRAEVRNLNARVEDLTGRIERQADNHEADRDAWAKARSRMAARVAELEQTVVAMGVASGLDAAWPDVAAVSGPRSESQKSLGGK